MTPRRVIDAITAAELPPDELGPRARTVVLALLAVCVAVAILVAIGAAAF